MLALWTAPAAGRADLVLGADRVAAGGAHARPRRADLPAALLYWTFFITHAGARVCAPRAARDRPPDHAARRCRRARLRATLVVAAAAAGTTRGHRRQLHVAAGEAGLGVAARRAWAHGRGTSSPPPCSRSSSPRCSTCRSAHRASRRASRCRDSATTWTRSPVAPPPRAPPHTEHRTVRVRVPPLFYNPTPPPPPPRRPPPPARPSFPPNPPEDPALPGACLSQISGWSSGTNERSPPGSRVVGTESPLGRCMMKLTGFVSSLSGIA